MQLARTRSLFFLVFIACAMIVGSVVYLQCVVVGLSPCVLCLWQRAVFVASGLVAFIATIHAPGRAGCGAYSAVILLLTLSGAAIAGGQVWLQTATIDQTAEVIAQVERLLDMLSLHSQVDRLRSDAAFCAEISWSLFGISLPEWSLLAFVGLALVMLYALFNASVRAPTAESRAGD
ncbi:disulfide bond formation protein B [Pseudomonas phytophila]|uniref:Disulfide bond formation protein B n=1 Tax=Pseudomonas phytophila TaxID=2867264 RepID=A0ABY6FF22_9PSED|nr:disulfide bond formation protein B [Pseudomonas phytophila]UXZ96447.1 disulfide bond formation protein B [Pseudomonas phytophila]